MEPIENNQINLNVNDDESLQEEDNNEDSSKWKRSTSQWNP